MVKKIVLAVLFCFIVISILCSPPVHAIDMFSPSDASKYGVYQSETVDGGTKISVGGTLRDFEQVLKTARTEYCKKFQACAEEKYANKAIIGKVEIVREGGSKKEYPLTNKDFNDSLGSKENVSGFNDSKYEVKIGLSESYTYTYQAYNIYMECVVGCSIKVGEDGVEHHYTEYGIVPKSSAGRYQNLSPHEGECFNAWSDAEVDYLETMGGVGENTIAALEKLADAVRVGLVAGSVGSGYNVGTVYSNSQISLTNAMEKTASGYYDFKTTSGLKSTFEYYMNPLLGKADFLLTNNGVIPSTIEEWTSYIERAIQNNDFVSGYEIILNPVFDAFESSLTDDGRINSQGLKKTENISFSNGVKNIKDIATSRKPKSVISYNMKIALPYIFYQSSGDRYKLDMNQLRLLDGYSYCVSNDFMYALDDSGVVLESVANINSLELNRDQLFLYKYVSGGNTYGVILVGQFHEGVLDTTNGLTYATGRNIGFNNGYSDMLTLNSSNVNLMYSIGSLSNSGRNGFLPRNVAFPVSESEMAGIQSFNNSQSSSNSGSQGAGSQGSQSSTAKPLELSNDSAISYVEDKQHHAGIDTPKYFKIIVGFEELKNQQATETTTSTQTPTQTGEKSELKGFVIYWNNYYVNDSDLLSWLRSNEAHGITYVDADTLIAKITGDFSGNIQDVSYDAWQKMKDIRAELEARAERKWYSAFNVLSICAGVFLIMFAILLCLAYWIDIFNTFVDVSLLYLISFGNMYSIWDKDTIPYVQESKGATRFVTFPQVLLRAFFLIAIGLMLMDITKIISLIMFLYEYIMMVFSML